MAAMKSTFDCEICGQHGFMDFWALRGHQVRNGLCQSKQRAAQRAAKTDLDNPFVNPMNKYIHTMSDEAPAEVVLNMNIEDEMELSYEDPVGCRSEKDFDATFQLIFFIKQCHNGGGLSFKDTNMLLRLLHHSEFDMKQVTIRNAMDICKYKNDLKAEREDLVWTEVEVREESEDVPSIRLFHRNALHVLESLYSSPKNKEDFALRSSTERDDFGEKLYTNLQSGDWWQEMDKNVEAQCRGGVVAPIILYSDQTSLSNNRRTQGWPLVMTLGNINSNLRSLPKGHGLLGILPMIGSNDPGVSDKKVPSRVKLELFHKCLDIILGPLKEASHNGVHLQDPSGNSQWVFPKVCLYICDQTEGSKVTCTFDSNKSNFPCSTCFVQKKSLSAVSKVVGYRTEQGMKDMFKKMEHSSLEEREVMSKEQSIHPVQCALWGFCGGELPLGNPYRCIQLDGLHQSILGVFKTLVTIVRASASSTALVRQPLRELDKRLKKIQKHSRYASFRIPGTTQGGYFQANSNFHGFEHKAIMQVVVFCLLDVIPDEIVQVFVNFIDWYLLAFRSKGHTESSLVEIDSLAIKAVKTMKRHAKTWQKSNFDLVKVHWMSHLKDCIKRRGLPAKYDTRLYEHMHIALMKTPYRHSNRQNFMGQIVKHHQRMKVLIDEADLQDTNLRVHKEDLTALDKAVLTGQNVLSGKGISFRLGWLDHNRRDFFPQEVIELFDNQPEIRQYFTPTLLVYVEDEGYKPPEILQIWNSLAITAGKGDRFADWPMYTRACQSFHGSPWFGFVQLQIEAAHMDPVVWVGQLRLLFSCELFDGVGRKVLKQLAFVRVMEELPRGHCWKMLKCEQLKFVDEIVNDSAAMRRQKSKIKPKAEYIVVDIANVARVVHVVPYFTQEGTFWLNRFKL